MSPGVDPNTPFDDLPDLPPAVPLVDGATSRLLVEAHRALAELKGYSQTLPNPEILLSNVVLGEGKDSSGIENIFTTYDALFKAHSADLPTLPESPEKEVLRYREALFQAWDGLRESGLITTNLLVDTVQILKGNTAGVRTAQVFIGDRASNRVIYTPPSTENVIQDRLAALERFINAPDPESAELDPLVRMALIHYQFEAIHPFLDGNGRTGRILNVLYLVQQGLLDSPILYLSGYILGRKADYYRVLSAVPQSGAWQEWTEYMLTAVRDTSRATLALIRDMNAMMEEFNRVAEAGMRNGYSVALIRLLFQQPYCRIRFVVEAGLAARGAASRYLKGLEELGLVVSRKDHREKYFINQRLIERLKSFRA